MKRAALNNINLYAIIQELADLLENSYITNVYEVGDLLLFKMSSSKFEGKRMLLIDHTKRVHLTDFKYPTPQYPSQFCMALRKHLKKKRVLRVYQHHLDRIFIIEINNPEGEPWKFIVEFFGGGNYYLLRPDGTIFMAKHYKILRNRRILAREEYQLPGMRGLDPLTLTKEDFASFVGAHDDELVREIARNLNVGGVIAEEICARSGVPKDTKLPELSESDVSAVYGAITEFFDHLRNRDFQPQIILDENHEPTELLPFDFVYYADTEKKMFDSMNRAADEYYGQFDIDRILAEKAAEKKELLSKEQRILKQQEENIEKSEKAIEKNQKIGDLIYKYFGPLEELLRIVNEAKFVQKLDWDEIKAKLDQAKNLNIESALVFSRFVPSTKDVFVTLDDVSVKLDLEKSVQDNATVFYNRVKKARKKIEGAREAIKKTQKRLKKKKADKEQHEGQLVGLIRDRKKAWYEKFHWFWTSDGYLVIGGRDAQTNELIVKKYVAPTDLILHTEMRGSPIGVIKKDSEDMPPQSTIEQAAEFIASFSKAWSMAWSGVDIFWVKPEQVSKTPKSGEFLPKGSFFIEGKKNFISTGEQVHRIGLLVEEKTDSIRQSVYYEFQVISGPPASVEGKTDIFVDIRPSKKGLGSGPLAKKIRAKFKQEIPDDKLKWMKGLPLEEIQFHIPGGLGELKE